VSAPNANPTKTAAQALAVPNQVISFPTPAQARASSPGRRAMNPNVFSPTHWRSATSPVDCGASLGGAVREGTPQ
jgi:hypothetical protein